MAGEMRVQDLRNEFNKVKIIGSTAEDLANKVIAIHEFSQEITEFFESKMVPDTDDPDFMQNFYSYAGADAVQYAQSVYTVLKEMQVKLESLG